MAGQLWAIPAEGGFMYSDELSDVLRQQVQPLTKMRQLCDAEDGTKKGLNRGDKFNWDERDVPVKFSLIGLEAPNRCQFVGTKMRWGNKAQAGYAIGYANFGGPYARAA
jgi:hypothetical protein